MLLAAEWFWVLCVFQHHLKMVYTQQPSAHMHKPIGLAYMVAATQLMTGQGGRDDWIAAPSTDDKSLDSLKTRNIYKDFQNSLCPFKAV